MDKKIDYRETRHNSQIEYQRSQEQIGKILKVPHCLNRRSKSFVQQIEKQLYKTPKDSQSSYIEYLSNYQLNTAIIESHSQENSMLDSRVQQSNNLNKNLLEQSQLYGSVLIKRTSNNENIFSDLNFFFSSTEIKKTSSNPNQEIDKFKETSSQYESNTSQFAKFLQINKQQIQSQEKEHLQAHQKIERLYKIIDIQSNTIKTLTQKYSKIEKENLQTYNALDLQIRKNEQLCFIEQLAVKRYKTISQLETKLIKKNNTQQSIFQISNRQLQIFQLVFCALICLAIVKLF